MKKLIFCWLIIGSFTLSAQNIASVSVLPTDLGIGLRYDRLFKDFGMYAGASYGNYKLGEAFIHDHYRASLGVTVPFVDGFVSTGLNYHRYGESHLINERALDPVSFDLGGGVFIEWFVVAIRFDFIKGEGCIDLGVCF